jgi:hypothetical protein
MRPQPRVRNKKAHEHSHYGHTGITRHSLRNGFNGFLRALPGDRACLSPSSAIFPADLTPASRRQDHTTSPSASAPFVSRAVRVHRIPLPTSVTIAKRPSEGAGRIDIDLIWAKLEREYFCKQNWTGQISLIEQANLAWASRRIRLGIKPGLSTHGPRRVVALGSKNCIVPGANL